MTLNHTEQFVQQLTDCQPRLRALIEMLIGDRNAANDVLQDTNVELWRKAEEFVLGTDFSAWAATIARFKVLSYVRDVGRDRLVVDADLVTQLVEHAEHVLTTYDARRDALQACLEKLTPTQRELIQERYFQDRPVRDVAQRVGRSEASVLMGLSRIRQLLFECIRQQLTTEGGK